jgi:predicted ArsR family transcriptional regulator
MMRQVLQLMANGCRPLAIADLATAVGVQPLVVRDVLARLTTLGYVQDIACAARTEKNSNCVTCRLENGCDSGRPPHVWVLTDNGRRALSKGSEAPAAPTARQGPIGQRENP